MLLLQSRFRHLLGPNQCLHVVIWRHQGKTYSIIRNCNTDAWVVVHNLTVLGTRSPQPYTFTGPFPEYVFAPVYSDHRSNPGPFFFLPTDCHTLARSTRLNPNLTGAAQRTPAHISKRCKKSRSVYRVDNQNFLPSIDAPLLPLCI